MESFNRRLHPGALVSGIFIGGALYALGTYAFTWISSHPIRMKVQKPPGYDDLYFEDVICRARDGVQLSGWYIPAHEARGIVILCHGHPMNRVEMLPWARLLNTAGFHTFLFDFRAMGESGGDLSSIGYQEVNDLLGVVDYLRERGEFNKLAIGAYGISMGAAVCIMAASQDERIAAVAAHGAYATLDRAIRQRSKVLLGPGWPLLYYSALTWGRHWLQVHPHEVSPLADIAKIAPRPLMLSHGDLDMIINPEDARDLYAAAANPKTLRMLPRSWHIRIHSEERDDYQQELVDFFRSHLKSI